VDVAGVDLRPQVVGEAAQVLLDTGERFVPASGLREDHGDVVCEHRLVVLIEPCERVTNPDSLIEEPAPAERHWQLDKPRVADSVHAHQRREHLRLAGQARREFERQFGVLAQLRLRGRCALIAVRRVPQPSQ
jgi:hypothetical protein